MVAIGLPFAGEALALLEVLPEQSIEVLVTAPLPRMVRIGKEATNAGGLLDLAVAVELGAVVPGNRLEWQAAALDQTNRGPVHREHRAVLQANDLRQALTEPRIHDWKRAQAAIQSAWPFLQGEPDLEESTKEAFALLDDVMRKETFFREFPAIDQSARTIEEDYRARHKAAADARLAAYTDAIVQVKSHASWPLLTEEQQQEVASPLESFAKPAPETAPIPQLRADADACDGRLKKAIEAMMRIVDGNRLVSIPASEFFQGGIENEEQLDSALGALRERIVHQIGQGKKVLIQ